MRPGRADCRRRNPDTGCHHMKSEKLKRTQKNMQQAAWNTSVQRKLDQPHKPGLRYDQEGIRDKGNNWFGVDRAVPAPNKEKEQRDSRAEEMKLVSKIFKTGRGYINSTTAKHRLNKCVMVKILVWKQCQKKIQEQQKARRAFCSCGTGISACRCRCSSTR